MKFADIRSCFLDYYAKLGFQYLPPAPMLHSSIPMSFVMSAGLVQVETSLANTNKRTGNKFMLVQNCFRHFDLDTVGTDNVHLSLFEMPGAFTFGSNGKEIAIHHMWRLATQKLGIDENRIWASYFIGGDLGNKELRQDEITRRTWTELGLPESRIVGLGVEHNFWTQGGGSQMNGNGEKLRKYGPNTELFYDRGEMLSCCNNCLPGCKCGRFIEFANSLFIHYEMNPKSNKLTKASDPFIETVIGTERVAMILQGTNSIFGTIDYLPIIKGIHDFINCSDLPPDLITKSKRVVADYLKALCVLIADNAPLPGKGGRARIIRILVRGVLTQQSILGIHSKDFLPTVIRLINESFDGGALAASPNGKKVEKYFAAESHCFNKTIEHGRRAMELCLVDNQGKTLNGAQILRLEKKRGLPHSLIAMLLQEDGLEFVESEYKNALADWYKGNSKPTENVTVY